MHAPITPWKPGSSHPGLLREREDLATRYLVYQVFMVWLAYTCAAVTRSFSVYERAWGWGYDIRDQDQYLIMSQLWVMAVTVPRCMWRDASIRTRVWVSLKLSGASPMGDRQVGASCSYLLSVRMCGQWKVVSVEASQLLLWTWNGEFLFFDNCAWQQLAGKLLSSTVVKEEELTISVEGLAMIRTASAYLPSDSATRPRRLLYNTLVLPHKDYC